MANIKIQPEKRYLYTKKKSAGNMKTTSIYTLFFSPTGTSRKIAAAVAQGMTETEGTATEESAGHNADAAQAPLFRGKSRERARTAAGTGLPPGTRAKRKACTGNRQSRPST